MKITTSTEEGLTVLDLEGKLTVGEADTKFSTAIERFVDAGKNVIVLDMKKVEFIDSTGLGSLVRSHYRCVQAGGEIRLADVRFEIWDLFEAAKITDVMPVFENRRQAIHGRDGL